MIDSTDHAHGSASGKELKPECQTTHTRLYVCVTAVINRILNDHHTT